MKLRRRTVLLALGALVVAAMALPQFTLRGPRAAILRALSGDLGRQVEADSVHLRLLPYPGIELDGLRLADAPQFGAEDMVMADDAIASFRIASLLGGHLAFSSIHLDNASINLVRNQQGRWNIAALLDRESQAARHSPGAAAAGQTPGGKGGLGPGQRFPYIEWSDSRVNFKLEMTKTRFYLDQVSGSLARDGAGWRLQAQVVPERTDLNLSNTGEVTINGRWPAAGTGFRQRPFTLQVGLSDSYLAGASALIFGHDAGVHGILSAQATVSGTAQAFQIEGAFLARSVRRWDLLPPAASVGANFEGTYIPAQDQFRLTGLGDAGFQHVNLQGVINNVFTRPQAVLHLVLQQYPARNLIPLALAVKANLPQDLGATGAATGAATVTWDWGQAPSGRGAVGIDDLDLRSGTTDLLLPEAHLQWAQGRISLAPAAASLRTTAAGGAAKLRLGAWLDGRQFQIRCGSAAISVAQLRSLSRLFGLNAPLPPNVAGVARLQLELAAPWNGYREVNWSGSAYLQSPVMKVDGPAIDLHGLAVRYGPGQAVEAHFVQAQPGNFSGTVQVLPGETPAYRFNLETRSLHAGAFRDWLRPQAQDLVQRIFGRGGATWLGSLQAAGDLKIAKLDWHGLHPALTVRVEAAPGDWHMPALEIRMGGGRFAGQAELTGRAWRVEGSVPPAAALGLASLLRGTPFAGVLSGRASGTLQMRRPPDSSAFDGLRASGRLRVRDGSLRTRGGTIRFQEFIASYVLRDGDASLSDVVWRSRGVTWKGSGSAVLSATGVRSFALELKSGKRELALRSR